MASSQGTSKRVLSIQSHVVHGYVGNKAACFPLNRLGFDVDAINSVQFSNHTGYDCFKGQVLDGNQLDSIVSGLEENGMLSTYSHLLTGYIGSVSMLDHIVDVVEKLREANPDLVYVCDPVQGDDGCLYCPPDMPEAFREKILPLASIITPNQFEAELLTSMKIRNLQDAAQACKVMHAKGPSTVILTSLVFDGQEETIHVMASRAREGSDGVHTYNHDDSSSHYCGNDNRNDDGGMADVYVIEIPRLQEYFTGTGDLFSALLLAWTDRFQDDLISALELAVAGLQEVIKDTALFAEKEIHRLGVSNKKDPRWWRSRELRIVQNQDSIVHPVVNFHVKRYRND